MIPLPEIEIPNPHFSSFGAENRRIRMASCPKLLQSDPQCSRMMRADDTKAEEGCAALLLQKILILPPDAAPCGKGCILKWQETFSHSCFQQICLQIDDFCFQIECLLSSLVGDYHETHLRVLLGHCPGNLGVFKLREWKLQKNRGTNLKFHFQSGWWLTTLGGSFGFKTPRFPGGPEGSVKQILRW
jgi:hypothetical protein